MTRRNTRFIKLAGLWLASFFVLLSCDPPLEKEQVFIAIADDFSTVSVEGIQTLTRGKGATEFSTEFQLFILNDEKTLRPGQSAITGTYRKENGALLFEPDYPFLKDKYYRARFNLGDEWIERTFYIRNTNRPNSEVSQIYPSADELPLNVLKFYIQFTDSMSRGFAYDNIHFLNAAGDTLKEVYLDLEEELWSPDMKRFTLLLDPGRIKRGLKSLEELGYVFAHDQHYSLVVSKNWHDAHDMPMTNAFEKQFVTAGLYESYQGGLSINTTPRAGTKEPLSLLSAFPNDYALLQRLIHLTDKAGNKLAGEIEIKKHETLWKFTPAEAWKDERHEVHIATILEDVAGNNLLNPFDVDNRRQRTVLDGSKEHILSFRPKE